jgi:hypothetical protein
MYWRPVSKFVSVVFLAKSNTTTATTLPTDRRRTTNTWRTHALFVRWHGAAREGLRREAVCPSGKVPAKFDEIDASGKVPAKFDGNRCVG